MTLIMNDRERERKGRRIREEECFLLFLSLSPRTPLPNGRQRAIVCVAFGKHLSFFRRGRNHSRLPEKLQSFFCLLFSRLEALIRDQHVYDFNRNVWTCIGTPTVFHSIVYSLYYKRNPENRPQYENQ